MSVVKLEAGRKLRLYNCLRVVLPGVLRCFVELRLNTGNLLEPRFEIPLVAPGLFSEDTRLMPNEGIVFAKFFITLEDGITDADYEVGVDVYRLDTTLTDLGLRPVLVDEITAVIVPGSEVVAVLEQAETIIGTLEEDAII